MKAAQFAAHARLEERHWWFTARREILLRLLRAVTPAGGAVADIGCGTGGNAAAFAAAGFDTIGFDPSREAIALATARFPDTTFRCTDDPADAAGHLASGGTVVMTDVLEHVDDDGALLGSAVRATPPGGHLILTVPADPTLWSQHDVTFGHRRRYRLDEFRDLWRESPVSERLCTHYNARLRPLIAPYRRLASTARATQGGDLDTPLGPLNLACRLLFGSEAAPLVRGLDRARPPFRRGVSLVAVLRRR